jgi:transcription antitermination factor NusG
MGPTQRELCPNWQNDGAVVLPPVKPLPWFAVAIKPQHERAVADGLFQKGLESFLPMYWAARRWSDRVKRLQLPLFPGYVFCRFEYGQRLPVLRTPGVRSIVSCGPEVIPVPDEDIDRIRRMVTSDCSIEPWPFLKAGQRVRVNDGPLIGLEGTLAEFRSTWRVVVGLELMQRSVAVQLARYQITPL